MSGQRFLQSVMKWLSIASLAFLILNIILIAYAFATNESHYTDDADALAMVAFALGALSLFVLVPASIVYFILKRINAAEPK